MIEQHSHTDDARLRAFATGRLDDTERLEVQDHLDRCDSCFARLEQTGLDDSFVSRLVDAHASAPHPAADDTPLGKEGSAPTAVDIPRTLPTVPGYEIQGELGRGGMGVVYRARQVGLDRLVALKMILAGSHASPEELTRFRSEAEAVARLAHPNIVQIYEIGRNQGLPYFALELVEGGSLKEYLHGGKVVPPRQAASLVEAVARGIHAAHREGIVHRDLKPANILLAVGSGQWGVGSGQWGGGSGQWGVDSKDSSTPASSLPTPHYPLPTTHYPLPTIPKITDFGLARRLGQNTGLTETGAVVGTPQYMAPEQARGHAQAAGAATDVYALGAILYELLTGRPPFQGISSADILFQVLHAEPVPPHRLQPGVPRDLETICLKCLGKEPERRYASAWELAEDLAAFLDHRPIRARPASAWERARLWARRRPAIAALLALVVGVTLLGFGLVSWQWYEAETARREAGQRADNERTARVAEHEALGQAEAQRQKAEGERRRASAMSASLALDQGIKLCQEGQTDSGLLWMARALELLPEAEDDLEYAIRTNLTAWQGQFVQARLGPAQGATIMSIALSPDGTTALTGNWGENPQGGGTAPSVVSLWSMADWGQAPLRTVAHPGPVWSVAFSPDGRSFAVGGHDGTAQIWDTARGTPVHGPLPHGGPVLAVAFSPDGRTLAVGGFLKDPMNPRVFFGGQLRLWDTETGKQVGEPIDLEGVLFIGLSWSPDGQTLAIAGSLGKNPAYALRGAALLVDVPSRKVREPRFYHADSVTSVCFHPDGVTLASGCLDGHVRFWDTRKQVRLPTELIHPYPIHSIAFSKDGRAIAAGGGLRKADRVGPGEARLWDVATGELLVQPMIPREPRQENTVRSVVIAQDCRTVLTAGDNQRATRWTMPAPALPVAAFSSNALLSVDYSQDGSKLLTYYHASSTDAPPGFGEVRLYHVATGAPTGVVLSHPTPLALATFSPDDRRVVTVSHPEAAEHVLRVWETETGKAVPLPAELSQGILNAKYSADGQTLFTGGADGKLRRWDATTLGPLGDPLDQGARIVYLALAPNGRTVLTVDETRIRFWSLPDGAPRGPPIEAPSYQPNWGEFTGDSQLAVIAWSKTGGNASAIMRCRADGTVVGQQFYNERCLVISQPSGKRFLRLFFDGIGQVSPGQLWDPITQLPEGAPVPARTAIHFHPSGRYAALAGAFTEHATLWSMIGKPIGPPILHPGRVAGVYIDPQGRVLATKGNDNECRLWKLPQPVSGTPAQVRDLVEALTGVELDQAGSSHELGSAELALRRERLDREGVSWQRERLAQP